MSEEERGAVHVEVRGECVALCFEEEGARQGRALYLAPADAYEIARNLINAAEDLSRRARRGGKAEDAM